MKFWFIMFWIQSGVTIGSLYGWRQSLKLSEQTIKLCRDILESQINEKEKIKLSRNEYKTP